MPTTKLINGVKVQMKASEITSLNNARKGTKASQAQKKRRDIKRAAIGAAFERLVANDPEVQAVMLAKMAEVDIAETKTIENIKKVKSESGWPS